VTAGDGGQDPTNHVISGVGGIESEEAVGTPAVAQIVTVQTLASGYRAAVARFTEAVDRRDPPEETYLPLFEALNWAVSLDDRLKRPDVEVAKGLRWVRNLVHHQWADALESSDVLIPRVVRASGHSQIVGPIVVLDWFWRPVERLPEPDKRSRHEPEQREAYIALLAERRAREPLERLLDDLGGRISG
jgi:hypothetical protein